MLDPRALARDLRDNAFGGRRHTLRPPSIGAEVELLPVDAETRAPVPVCAAEGRSTLPFLRAFAGRHRWTEQPSPYGAPVFVTRDGGTLSYEPGGQLELSAPPFRSASALLASLRGAVVPLVAEAAGEGIELLSVGIDPLNGVEQTSLQLPGRRYRRLTRFMQDQGTGGERMMRQTAAFQCNLDWGDDAAGRWHLLNALAPAVVAIFASSPLYRGRLTGEKSFRARVWRELDGRRTGLVGRGGDAVQEYLDFALRAPAILLEVESEEWLPLAEWNARGRVSWADWQTHLTTLFPEVRPKGFVEVRSADAVAPEWYAAPLVFLAGLLYHAPSFQAARELAGDPDPGLLLRAGRNGLDDAVLGTRARDLFALALQGAAALGREFIAPADLAEASDYFARYTARGRSPADEIAEAFAPTPAEMAAAD